MQRREKKSLLTLLALLSCLLVILFLSAGLSFGKDEKAALIKDAKRLTMPTGLNIGWQATYGRLNLKALKDFLKKEQIQMISFVGKNGSMFVVDSSGREIGFNEKEDKIGKGKWCKINGSDVEKDCFKTNIHTITNANQMTVMNGHGSPEEGYIWIDGYMICWNFVYNRPCD